MGWILGGEAGTFTSVTGENASAENHALKFTSGLNLTDELLSPRFPHNRSGAGFRISSK